MQIITLKLISYNGKKRIAVFFKYDQRLIDRIKNIPDRKWDAKNKCWHIPYRDNYLDYLNKEFKGEIKFIPCESLSIKNDHTVSETNNGNSVRIPKEYLETLKLKRYSKNTIKSYLNHFKHFLDYYHNIKPQEISEEQIRDFLLYIVDDKKVSNSYQNQAINSIKFYYEQVLGKPVKNYYLQRPKKEKKLPTVLSEEEVIKILSQIENLKHKCIIYLIYSAGLRRNELINLRIKDINGSRKIILINGGKGKKIVSLYCQIKY